MAGKACSAPFSNSARATRGSSSSEEGPGCPTSKQGKAGGIKKGVTTRKETPEGGELIGQADEKAEELPVLPVIVEGRERETLFDTGSVRRPIHPDTTRELGLLVQRRMKALEFIYTLMQPTYPRCTHASWEPEGAPTVAGCGPGAYVARIRLVAAERKRMGAGKGKASDEAPAPTPRNEGAGEEYRLVSSDPPARSHPETQPSKETT